MSQVPKKIKINKDTGEILEADLVTAFEIPDFGRKYVIYTFNEVDPNGLIKLNVSQLVEEDSEEGSKYIFKKIETDDEWTRIKNVMREIITGGNA